MKYVLTLSMGVALLSGCASTGPETAWGKPGVSREDYVADLGTCMGTAGLTPVGNGANQAGGLSGKNQEAPAGQHSDYGRNQSGGGTVFNAPGAGSPVIVGGGGMYRDSTPPDVVNRAATQQQSEQMAAQRAATDTYRTCYVQHGYQEFNLTPEQRRHLGTLKRGTNEYLEYLADIG